MRFPEETRKAIHAAKGKAVEIDWPQGEPQPGHRYSVQSSNRAGQLHVLVLFTEEVDDARWRAMVRTDADPVRTLPIKTHKGIEADPMGGPQFRSEYEPERVSREEEQRITRAANAAFRKVIHHEIGRLEDQLQRLRDVPELQGVGGDLKFIESLLRKAEQKALGAVA